MNVLDENIPADQRELLRSRGVHARQIGYDVGRPGMQDDEVVVFLRRVRRATFFTRDGGFYDRRLCHATYCLVYLDVEKQEVALFVRRLLKHCEFDTQAKRMGAVVRLTHAGLWVWRLNAKKESRLDWPE